ncbi:hypothetical protein A2903_00940 [Candidatus Nomurabacteria bacterium RIFCSPLOWO2_01_FULL_33_17]|uniref:DUF2231 domain-containing protein n=1 Tax=Candidatus Nomurabacteria bacterium RIFCSPLOWO2_01_FULL_33_17 TaxID=1801764 RepID=A0A1F6WPV0_9BACT|nr:MAG: hypothetical protein A2903_00940 [Candidatus Nomurabacteria bacterium RIFCSPLOWO2_01_FULL_33_17]
MQYNIHPIIVHFPIAMLFLYSIIKVLPFKKWFPNVSWKHIEIVLLLVGVVSAFTASSTGEIAEELVRPNEDVLGAHQFFAGASTWIYSLILVGEALVFLIPKFISKFGFFSIIKLFTFFEKILTNNILVKILAILGLISIILTGLLGGVMVYGTTADPLAAPILKLLGISL